MVTQKILKFCYDHLNLAISFEHPKEALKFAKKHFDGKGVSCLEIGVFEGRNAQAIHETLNVLDLYLIDPYENYEEYQNDASSKFLKKARIKSHNRLKGYNNNKWIYEFSEFCHDRIKNNSIDFIYIDGNHEYGFVKDDLENYFSKLKKGGIMGGHDIQHLGVSDAVLEFANKNNLRLHFGDKRDWWFIKE